MWVIIGKFYDKENDSKFNMQVKLSYRTPQKMTSYFPISDPSGQKFCKKSYFIMQKMPLKKTLRKYFKKSKNELLNELINKMWFYNIFKPKLKCKFDRQI